MKNINKLLSIVISAILVFTPCCAYAEPTEGENKEIPVTEEENNNEEETNKPVEDEKTIKLDKSSLILGTEQEASLTATVTPSNSTIEWSSDNEEVATVDQNGKITTKKSAGTATITATIKGTEISATCTVEVTRTIGTDATLKSLTIENGKLDKTFKSNVFEYSVTVDSTVDSLIFTDLQADLNDSNAGYMVPSASNKNLKNGSLVRIVVTAEDEKTQNEYKLTIVKDTVSLDLKYLEINGYALNEVFDKNVLEYTASIPYEIDTITINANSVDSDVTVSGTGTKKNLFVGDNVFKITVKDDSGNNRTYTIKVTREKETSVEENPTSIITSSNIIDKNNNSSNSVTPDINNDGSGDDFLKYAIVSLACLILFVIGGIGIYFYLKTSPKKLRKELAEIKKEEEVSPIVEVEPETENKNQVNIEEMMQEDLVQTKEFKKEELEEISKTENLFDDSEDV